MKTLQDLPTDKPSLLSETHNRRIIIDSDLFLLASQTRKNSTSPLTDPQIVRGLILNLLCENSLITPNIITGVHHQIASLLTYSDQTAQNIHTLAHILSQTEIQYIATRQDVISQLEIITYLTERHTTETLNTTPELLSLLKPLQNLEALARNQIETLPSENTTQRILLNKAHILQKTHFNSSTTLQEIESVATQIANLELEAERSAPVIAPDFQKLFIANRYNAILHTNSPLFILLAPFFKHPPVNYRYL